MPGITGAVAAGARRLVERMEAALYAARAAPGGPARHTVVGLPGAPGGAPRGGARGQGGVGGAGGQGGAGGVGSAGGAGGQGGAGSQGGVGSQGGAGSQGDSGGGGDREGEVCFSVRSLLGGAGVCERDGTCLAFEGWIAEPRPPRVTGDGASGGGELPAWLLARFLEHGPAFVEALRGSFQIAVWRAGETFLFADPVGSRPLFYRHDGDRLCFAPEVAPLATAAAGGAAALDAANLMQFLICGRCFAGQTLLAPVRQLLPGEMLIHRADGAGGGWIERRQHFVYQVEPRGGAAGGDPRGEDELLAELAELAERALGRALSQTRRPVFLLSGGYDSRYLFNTAARLGAAPAPLRSALHGQRMDAPGSDNVAARAVAARHGVEHLTLAWRGELVAEQLAEMFAAQSGMTDLIFTHSDELTVFRGLAVEHGFDAVLRGDECFGPKGGPVATTAEALRRCSMSAAGSVAGVERWFAGAAAPWTEAHDEQMARLLAGAPTAPAELRDTLYARERLAAVAAHHNYHKSHFLEMQNPLLDVDLLRFWSTLPESWRTDKRLFRECYHRTCGDHREVPIATLDNGVDWPHTLAHTPGLAAAVRRRLLALPAPLDGGYFAAQLDAVLRGEAAAAAPDAPGARGAPGVPGRIRVPPVKLVARGVVLGLWWESGWLA